MNLEIKMYKLTSLARLNKLSTLSKLNKNGLHATIVNFFASKQFEEAKSRLSTLKEDPGNEIKLKLYALFKQATVGPCNMPKPGMIDFVNRAKWTAWSDLKSLSQTEAEAQYIKLVSELIKSEPQESSTSTQAGSNSFHDIITSIEHNNVYKIVLNRPHKLNAITVRMYNELIQALNEADKNPNILMCYITGAGDYYCSGNDLTNFATKEAMENIKKAAKDGGVLLENFVNAFVGFSKPLIGVINGPAVGISVTLLGLFDMVLASDKATFNAPFTKIAQSPEACSSYTFPRMMGHLKAAEFLMFNRKLNALEAFERNLVTQIIPHNEFQSKTSSLIESLSKLPKESLLASRRIIREQELEKLKEVNKREVDVLVERWSSAEFVRVMTQFWSSKSKN